MLIAPEKMNAVLKDLFIKHHFTTEKAKLMASVFTESTLSGVHSHGINRVPLFIEHVKKGIIDVDSEATMVASFGTMERWDGNSGAGIVNATKCTNRAIELAKNHGMGMVALRNTNHWMRGGSYGHQAAQAGCISILFTNTKPNMPPWGATDNRIGNNPIVISIPRNKGNVVLDMALSQFSFGKINDHKLRGEQLAHYGGWDDDHKLTKDPEKILSNERGLPIGYWKGSALSMVLDMLATLLSAGNSTGSISNKAIETNISQVFLCIHPKAFNDNELQERLLEEIINFTRDATLIHPENNIYYPGERSAANRADHLKNGMTVNDDIWEKIEKLSTE